MTADLPSLVRAFRRVRAMVIGEAMLDSYLRGEASRLSREAPVPIVSVTGRTDAPGGAANTAVNVATLGARSALVSVVGDDDEGERLRATVVARGVEADGLVTQPRRGTLAKERILAGDQMLTRVDSGTSEALDADTEDRLIEHMTAAHRASDVVVVSDYDYGVVTPRILSALRDLQAASPRPLVVDARDLRRYRRLDVTAAIHSFPAASPSLPASSR